MRPGAVIERLVRVLMHANSDVVFEHAIVRIDFPLSSSTRGNLKVEASASKSMSLEGLKKRLQEFMPAEGEEVPQSKRKGFKDDLTVIVLDQMSAEGWMLQPHAGSINHSILAAVIEARYVFRRSVQVEEEQ